jgi:hypothetical protein
MDLFKMELIPVKEHLEENKVFIDNPECLKSATMSVNFYKKGCSMLFCQ